MIRKLYKVSVTVYALGTCASDAIRAAQEGVRHDDQDWVTEPATEVSRLWEDLIPYGIEEDEPEFKCSEVLKGCLDRWERALCGPTG